MSIFRFLILNILLILTLNAEAIKEQIFKAGYISTDGKTYTNTQKMDQHFFEKKHTTLFLKIEVNKKVLKDKVYYLRIESNPQNFISASVPHSFKNEMPIIKIDKNIDESFVLNFNFHNRSAFFEVNIFNEFEHKYIMSEEKILFGIAYGIVICAFLYNFVFFLYNREKSFFYYSMLQISLLLVLFVISMDVFLFNLFEKYGLIVEFLVIFLLNITFMFSILFNMTFLNTKKHTPRIHKFLWFLIGLNLIDIVLILTIEEALIIEYIPSYLIILVLLFSAFSVLIKGYKPAIFYIMGWLTLFVFVFLSETSFSENSELYLLHVGIPLESLLFSFALGFKIRQIELEKQKNESILINQSKLASMGEMIGNIAHQWRQPLTHLSYIIMNLKAAHENDKLDKSYLQKKTDEATTQIEFMSHTIDDFRNFFKVSKQKESFGLVSCIKESINLLKESFKSLDIELKFEYEEDLKVKTYKGELSQVIFNLLNNAKEEFVRREIKEPKLLVNLIQKDSNAIIEISDNAGGIDEKIIKKIFEPYFTTKDKGLGIGLYMSKTIIEKNIEGKLEVENLNGGVLFTITLPKNLKVKNDK